MGNILAPVRTCDGDLDCEADIAAEFDALAHLGEERGWSPEQVANALLSLAQSRITGMRAVLDESFRRLN